MTRCGVKTFERRTRAHRRWLSVKNSWPFLVWLAACGACFWLFRTAPLWPGGDVIRGIVDAEAVTVAPVETARIKHVRVREGQRVERGDVLVEMDTSLIAHGVTADLIDALRIESGFGDTHQDVLQAVSQRRDAADALRSEIAACRQEWKREEAELAALRAEQARRDALRARQIIDDLTCTERAADLAALEGAVAQYPTRIAMYEQQLEAAETYYRHIMEWVGATAGEPLSEAISRRINEGQGRTLLRQAREEAETYQRAYTLRAPRASTVAAVLRNPGDVATADVPILRLVRTTPERILALLDETQVARLQPGMRVRLESMNRPVPVTAEAVVDSLSPEVYAAAYSLSPTGRSIPLRAQRALLRFVGPHPFIGGEGVYICPPAASSLRFLPTWAAGIVNRSIKP